MKIQYCSDLHLEFRENKDFLKQNPLQPLGDYLLLGGDIMYFSHIREHKDFFDFCSDHFEKTYWIPGNHEYYRHDIVNVKQPLNEKIRENVFLVNNQAIRTDEAELVFCTLWSYIPPQHEYIVQQNVNDFFQIKNNGRRLTTDDFNAMHMKDLNFLKQIFAFPPQHPRIVMTHHVPTLMNYPPQYKSSPINSAFATELYGTIESSEAESWIYGHSHYNTPAFRIGKTKVLSNQLGYVALGENHDFDFGAVVEV